MVLKGIKGIDKVFISQRDKPVFGIEPAKELILQTDGVNLAAILLNEDIDRTRTISNDLLEVCSTLGIEAARAVLMRELREVLDHYGIYVNYRHLALLCDAMT